MLLVMERLEHQYDESPAFLELVGAGLPPVIHGIADMPTGAGHSFLTRLQDNQ